MSDATSMELGDGVSAIDTDYVRPMFDASHLIVEDGRAAFVDTGPAPAVDLLLHCLREKNIDRADVEYVFLTHVHLDHAGGAGSLLAFLPNAVAVLHPHGAPHMIRPEKLIKGSKAVYGDELYSKINGTVMPVAENRVQVVDDGQALSLAGRELRCFFTEGHARHHYCLDDPASNGVFTGDSFGVSYRELDTPAGQFIFPSTTPVHFDPDEAHKSVDRIMACNSRYLYLTHFSKVTDTDRLADDMHRGIDDFVEIAERHVADNERSARMQESMFNYFVERLDEHGFAGGTERAHAVLDFDVWINTMGLESWLDRKRQ